MFDWTGIQWQIDVHVLDREHAATLRRFHEAGWLSLESSDTTRVEIAGLADDDKREELEDLAWQFPMPMGPFVLGHSQFDSSVVASEEDQARIEAVYNVLWPDNAIEDDAAPTSSLGRRRFRDALHVATAIRYGISAFITCDRRILAKRDELAELFGGFSVMCVSDATLSAFVAVQSVHQLQVLGSHYYGGRTPPSWPTVQDCTDATSGRREAFACASCPRR
jgi:hypothetical protein